MRFIGFISKVWLFVLAIGIVLSLCAMPTMARAQASTQTQPVVMTIGSTTIEDYGEPDYSGTCIWDGAFGCVGTPQQRGGAPFYDGESYNEGYDYGYSDGFGDGKALSLGASDDHNWLDTFLLVLIVIGLSTLVFLKFYRSDRQIDRDSDLNSALYDLRRIADKLTADNASANAGDSTSDVPSTTEHTA